MVLEHRLNRRRMLELMGVSGVGALIPLPDLPAPVLPDMAAYTAARPILFCDDSPEVLKLLGLIMQRVGWTAITTTSSRETIERCRTGSISMVVSDIMKPDMNGYDLLRHLRADPLTHDIPFAFLSGRRMQDAIDHGIALGADDYMIKPFVPGDLVACIYHVLQRRGVHLAPWIAPGWVTRLATPGGRPGARAGQSSG
jgi:CheY-like chemotaxis protein